MKCRVQNEISPRLGISCLPDERMDERELVVSQLPHVLAGLCLYVVFLISFFFSIHILCPMYLMENANRSASVLCKNDYLYGYLVFCSTTKTNVSGGLQRME
jgi:hypothetical protein